MPSPNELKKARYRAVAKLFDTACSNPAWIRSGLREPAPATWLALAPHRRAAYCAADRLMSPALRDQLIAEYPLAGRIWNSSVWACLGEPATPQFLEQQLRASVTQENSELDLLELFGRLALAPMEHGPFDLRLVVSFVCATRLSKTLGRQMRRERRPTKGLQTTLGTGRADMDASRHFAHEDLSGLLAMRLARALYLVAVDELLAPMAREVWVYAGHTFVSGLRADNARVRFSEDAFDFAFHYVKSVEAEVSLHMVQQEPTRGISAPALREIVAGALFGLTEPTTSKAHRTMTQMIEMGATMAGAGSRQHLRGSLILEPLD